MINEKHSVRVWLLMCGCEARPGCSGRERTASRWSPSSRTGMRTAASRYRVHRHFNVSDLVLTYLTLQTLPVPISICVVFYPGNVHVHDLIQACRELRERGLRAAAFSVLPAALPAHPDQAHRAGLGGAGQQDLGQHQELGLSLSQAFKNCLITFLNFRLSTWNIAACCPKRRAKITNQKLPCMQLASTVSTPRYHYRSRSAGLRILC